MRTRKWRYLSRLAPCLLSCAFCENKSIKTNFFKVNINSDFASTLLHYFIQEPSIRLRHLSYISYTRKQPFAPRETNPESCMKNAPPLWFSRLDTRGTTTRKRKWKRLIYMVVSSKNEKQTLCLSAIYITRNWHLALSVWNRRADVRAERLL